MPDQPPSRLEGEDHSVALNRVIAEYIQACDLGHAPDRAEILARHPELASELRQFFSQRDWMRQSAHPFRAASDALVRNLGPGQHVSYVGDYELLEEIARGGM